MGGYIAIIAVLELIIIIGFIIRDIVQRRETKVETDDSLAAVERLKLYSTLDFDKIDSRIDTYINDAGNKYKMEHFEYLEPEELYLNEELINDMIRGMIKEVRFKVTPAIIELLRLSYNIESEDDLVKFIYDRVKMYVLNYSLEVNATIED